MFRKALWQGLTYIFALLLAVSILASQVLEVGRSQVDAVLGTTSEILVSESTGKLYNTFLPDEDVLIRDDEGNITGADSNALIKRAVDLGRREAAEGSVLLKNNGALPLATGSKVTIMGARSVTPALNSRQGQASKGAYITFEQALSDTQTHFDTTSVDSNRLPAESNIQFDDLKYGLKENGATAGARFQLNQTVINAYNGVSSKPSLQESPTNDPKEPTLAQVGLNEGGANLASLAQYNDAAILVFGRPSSESSDYKKNGLAASLQTATITEPLQLTQNELDLVTFATNNFEKVIVLVNTNSPMEIGELKNNDKVDAVLWIGHPGNYGFLGVADVLCGKASPSGGLYDIYPTKNLSAV